MTTGGGGEEQGVKTSQKRAGDEVEEDGKREEEGGGGGHRKMAAALSHILSEQTDPEKRMRMKRKKKEETSYPSENDSQRKRKRKQKEENEATGLESVDKEPSLADDDNDDDVISNIGGDVVAGCRRLPEAATLDYERKLQRIATTGVVQLFNAVSQHSKQVQDKMKAAGDSERKKAKVLSAVDKGSFIDLLKGRRQEEEKKKWPVLTEDYMMKAKMRDWNKKEEEEEEGEEEESASESDSSDER